MPKKIKIPKQARWEGEGVIIAEDRGFRYRDEFGNEGWIEKDYFYKLLEEEEKEDGMSKVSRININ